MRRLLVLLALFAATASAGDWPQWSGPHRNATAPASGVFGAGEIGLREVWRRPVAQGISALAIHGERLFSLAAAEGAAYAFALHAGTGEELWRASLGAASTNQEWGPPSTPATDGKSVFVLSPACRLMALEAGTGQPVWQHDLKAEFNPGPMAAGCWTSPLLEGELLVVHASGEPDQRVMAFDKTSGAVVWSSPGAARAVRTSPAVTEIAGVRQVLVYAGKDEQGVVSALRLRDGALLWSLWLPGEGSYSFDTPIPLADGAVGVLTWDDFRALRAWVEGDTWKAEALWSATALKAEVQPFTLHAVFHAGHVYGLGGEYLVCLDAATGKTLWKEKTYSGSLIVVDGHLVLLSHAAGLLRVVEATPAGYREKARLEVFTPGAPTDTPPSFAGRRIYLRNSEEMVAIEVTVKGEGGAG